jgi:hypothetical protein
VCPTWQVCHYHSRQTLTWINASQAVEFIDKYLLDDGGPATTWRIGWTGRGRFGLRRWNNPIRAIAQICETP